MPLTVVNDSGTWAPAQRVSVFDRGWRSAKSIKRSDGAGNWTIIWAPSSLVTVTGPDSALSQRSGSVGAFAPTIVPSTFTVTLENVEPVAVAVLQKSSDSGATWADLTAWNAPASSTLTFAHALGAAGDYLIRASVTHIDGRVAFSNEHAITCYTKNLIGSTSNPRPQVGQHFTLAVSCGDCLPTAASGRWINKIAFRDISVSRRIEYGSPGLSENPQEIWHELAESLQWHYQETFADGSVIHSSPVLITSVAR